MSEQVGASLVLAQIINPAAPPPARPSAQPGIEGSQIATEVIKNTTQSIDIIDENTDIFASLLSELSTLEAQALPGTAPHADSLIRVQETTRPTAEPSPEAGGGNSLPAGGSSLPGSGNEMPAAGTIAPGLPLSEPLNLQNPEGLQPTAPLHETIVVRESVLATTQRTTAESPPLTELGRMALPPTAAPLNPESTAENRSANNSAQTGNSTNAVTAANTLDAGTSADQNDGNAEGDRQPTARGAQPIPDRSVNGGASISFSHDATGAVQAGAGLVTSASPATLGPGAAPPQTLSLLGQPTTWAEPLAERLAGIAARGTNTAEVRLHPPSLGQLEVRITINNDQASILVTSANADVREALQQAMPRLDGLLQSLGIELADAEVSDRHPREFSGEDGGDESKAEGTLSEADDPVADSDRLGILDTWA